MLIFFFNDTATTEIYTLSLHDALPILWEQLGATFIAVNDEPDGARINVRCGSTNPEVIRQAVLQNGLRSEEHTSELQSQSNLVCRLLLEKKKIILPIWRDLM